MQLLAVQSCVLPFRWITKGAVRADARTECREARKPQCDRPGVFPLARCCISRPPGEGTSPDCTCEQAQKTHLLRWWEPRKVEFLGSVGRVCFPALRPINQKKSRFWFPYPRFGVASPVTPPRHATFSSERENARSLGGAPGGACRKSLTPRSEVARWHHGRFRRDSVIRPGSPVNAQARKLLSNGIRPSP